MGVIAAVAAVVALVGPASAATDFTWSGAAGSGGWSVAGNWSGATSPAGSVGTLTFPALTSSPCTASPPTASCYQSDNDLTGLTAAGLSIDDSPHGFSNQSYAVVGNALTLGSGGLAASPDSGASGFGGASIAVPITLGADQTWPISGGSHGESLLLKGPVSGAHTLGITLTNGASLDLTADDEVGAVTVGGSGAVPGTIVLGAPGPSGGSATLGELNATDGNAISFADNTGLIAQPGQTGPITLAGGQAIIGVPGTTAAGAEQLTVNGNASLSSGTVSMWVNHAGATAGTDYSQLSASGTVTIGSGESLNLGGAAGSPPQCPTLHAGDVLTLVTAGSLSGTFANAAGGATISLNCSGGTQPTLQINYNATSVTATVVTGGGTTATSTTLGNPAPANPAADQPVTLTAQVTAGSGTPSGTVEFLDGGTPVTDCFARQLAGNPATATCSASFAAGAHSLTAQYGGGAGFGSSTSSPAVSLAVSQASTTTALAASSSAPEVGQSVIYTATVSPSQPGNAVEPTGPVAFADGGSPIPSCSAQPLASDNQVSCTVTYTSAGTHSITASYPGDSNFTGSASSPPQTVTVTQPAPGAPVNTTAPAISGTAQQGRTLTVTQGTWTNSPSNINDQWIDCDAAGNSCATSGPSGQSYTLSASDVGHTVRVLEAASNGSGAGSPAASAPTPVVSAPPAPLKPPPPLQLPPPAPPRPGLTIAANPHSGVVVGPELPSGNHGLAVATDGSCLLTLSERPTANAALAAARGHRRRARPLGLIEPVKLEVANAGVHYLPLIPTRQQIKLWRRLHRRGARAASGSPRDPLTVSCQPVSFHQGKQSAQTTTGASPTVSSGAKISGDPVRGHTLSFDGSFDGRPTSVSFQWEDCRGISHECSAISGTPTDPADGPSYRLQGSDVGFAIRAIYFATNSVGTSEGELGATSVVTGVPIPPQAIFTAEQLLDGDSVVLGGLDLDGFCRLEGFARSELDAPGGLFDWFCVGGPAAQKIAVETTTACQFEYPGLSVEAVGDGNTKLWTCREHGHAAGRAGTGKINVPPPPPPQKPLCRSFSGSNAGGSISLSVCNNQVTSLRAAVTTGACNTETAQGNSSSPFSDEASIAKAIPLSASGSFGFNFPGATVVNGQGQVNANGGSAGVGIGTGPAAVSGGFAFCTAHGNFVLH